MKHLILRIAILFSITISANAQSLLNNGSFENHNGSLPMQGNNYYYVGYPSIFDYDISHAGHYSWINIAIGQCLDPRVYDGDNYYINPAPNNCNNWFTPTIASSDYFHRNCTTYTEFVQVPLIRVGFAGNTNYEMRQPSNYPYGFADAYTGIYVKSNFNDINGSGEHREYIQSKLLSKMEKGKLYFVSFKVSRTNCILRDGSIYQMGAWLSKEPEIQLTTNTLAYYGDLIPIRVDKEGILRKKVQGFQNKYEIINPQVRNQPNNPLNQSADANGLGGWMEISGYVYGDDYEWITIGNFEERLRFEEIPDPGRGEPGTYYFIDDISVTEVPVIDGCICGEPYYSIEIESKKNDNQNLDPDYCCFDFTLTLPEDIYSYGCPLLNFKIYAVTLDQNNQEVETLVYNHNNSVASNSTVTGDFCCNKNLTDENGNLKLRVWYHVPLPLLDCFVDFDMTCECDCATAATSAKGYQFDEKINFNITSNININGKCCFDLWLSSIDCNNKDLKYINIQDVISSLPAGAEVSSGDWLYMEEMINGYLHKGFVKPQGSAIYPNDMIHIGTICLPPSPSYNNIVTFKFSNMLLSDPGYFNCFTTSKDLSCYMPPVNCIDNISAALIPPTVSKEVNAECLMDLLIKQNRTIPENLCDIFKIEVKKNGHLLYKDSVRNNQPYWLDSIGTVFGMYLAEFDYTQFPPQADLTLDVCFYNINDSLIGCKTVSDYCTQITPGQGHANSVGDDILTKSNTKIRELKVYPNPSDDFVYCEFYLKSSENLSIKIVNSMGNSIEEIYDGYIEKENFNQYKINVSDFESGLYFVQIVSSKNIIISYPFVISK